MSRTIVIGLPDEQNDRDPRDDEGIVSKTTDLYQRNILHGPPPKIIVRLALEAADIESRPGWKPVLLQPVYS